MAAQQEFVPTEQELDAIGKAMKDAQFRKLLAEYAEELQNPENRKKYEEELRQMEAMQGNDVTFINPEPGWVLKTCLKGQTTKVFVNVCQSDVIEEPRASTATQGGQTGAAWSLPHSITTHREDTDKQGRVCIVYDAVFHPKALRLAEKDPRFKKMIETTALDGIEQRFPQHALERSDIKHPKMDFKGMPTRSVIRKKKDGSGAVPSSETVSHQLAASLKRELKPPAPAKAAATKKQPTAAKPSDEPEYTVVYQRAFDMADMRNAPDAGTDTRPTGVRITISLPACASAAHLDLDIGARAVNLTSTDGPYRLRLPLTYPVDEDKGTARFDKSKRQLVITLPVQPASVVPAAPLPTAGITALETQTQPLPAETTEAEAEAEHTEATNAVTAEGEGEGAAPAASATASPAVSEEAPPSLPVLPAPVFDQDEARLTIIIPLRDQDAANVRAEITEHPFGPVSVSGITLHVSGHVSHHFRFDAKVEEESLRCSATAENIALSVCKTPQLLWRRVQHAPEGKRLQEELLFSPALLKQSLAGMSDPWSSERSAQEAAAAIAPPATATQAEPPAAAAPKAVASTVAVPTATTKLSKPPKLTVGAGDVEPMRSTAVADAVTEPEAATAAASMGSGAPAEVSEEAVDVVSTAAPLTTPVAPAPQPVLPTVSSSTGALLFDLD